MSKATAIADRRVRAANSYAAAMRHSRRVRTLKVVFPVATALAVAAFVGSTMISRALPEGASVDHAAFSDGKIVMSNPVMTGQVGDDQSYSVAANRAVQDISTPSLIRLEDIVADFPFGDSEVAVLSALSGIFDRDGELLTFDQPFSVTTESGMTAKLSSAHIDIKSDSLTSDQRVEISTDKATLIAQSVMVEEKGATVTFGNGVHLTIKPGAVKPASEANAPESSNDIN
ncbi:hypothetical protein [Hoeflea prorocentri]|uniref:LPS export ABC transporter periplasmic protein LptC n=1 Tax=Hoeflea prorocentri TaxID=1922333 RepID=A0A9X3ZIC5_9HYPH|nr:hypothetical protein [Hoeflea prorocentri]MCY6382782.1 hypothetical protein [Hoeflea prorocentri]MDA5400582.1 hypothetical protein [Hoeflea prorocentri]